MPDYELVSAPTFHSIRCIFELTSSGPSRTIRQAARTPFLTGFPLPCIGPNLAMPSSQVGLTLQSVANPKFRQTRSGRCFSPYDIIAIQTDLELLPMLMGASAHQESTHEDDDEGHALEPPSYSAFDASQSPSTRHGPSLCHEGPKHTGRLSTNRGSCGSNNMKAGKRKRRCKSRQEKKATDYAIRPSLSAHHPAPAHLTTELKTGDLPATRGAYVGKSIPHGRKVWTLQELQADGYTVVPWDGM
ncbi:hypothetical protein BDR03DRAFT_1019260 [Suillus americanus]|nr:hypothetical protein BDR03DRAFT_1019260 [Suillus americanus]